MLFDPTIEDQTIKNWNNEWTKIAKREEDLLNEREKLIETAAHNEAVKRFARLASLKFENPIAMPADVYSTLQFLIEPVKETLLIESRANNQMESDIKKLDEIWKWLLVSKLDKSMNREEDES